MYIIFITKKLLIIILPLIFCQLIKMQRLIFVFLLLFAQVVQAKVASGLWDKYNAAVKSSDKIFLLRQLAAEYENTHLAMQYDSVVNMAVETAQLSGSKALLMDAYRLYFNKEISNPAEALDYAKNALGIAEKSYNNNWLYISNISYAKVLMAADDNKPALDKITKAYYYAGLTNNDTFKVECFLVWGKCLEQTNNKLDAFRNYLNALHIAQKHKMKTAVFDCYGQISFFYLLIGNYERAKEYKIKQLALVTENNSQPDSLQVLNLQSDLSIIYYYNHERHSAEKITQRIIQYATAHGDSVLFEKALFNHRIYLTENGLFRELADFYTIAYPKELEKLLHSDPISYHRIIAYIHEVKGSNDSALQDYTRTEQLVQEHRANEYLYVSNFMKRYAQFLLRTGNTKAAMQKMEASYNNARKADYLPYLIETSDYLDTLNYKAGNIADAYQYSKLNKEYKTRQDITTKQDALLLLEIDNETKQREIADAQELADTEHRHNIQYLGIVIAILLSFILLTTLGSFKVPAIFIKSLGFFSFIFFFEFIILLADHKIMEITHHEPWKMLAIKILIISFLLPFHHWIEHKVIHYLTAHKLIDPRKLSLKKILRS